MTAELARARRQLAEQSYAVMPGLYGEAAVSRLRETLARIHRDHGSPLPYARGRRFIADYIELSATGFVVHALLGFEPALQRGILHPDAVAVLREVLGTDMHLELVAGTVTSHARPFFDWHMHLGGIDDETYRRRGWRPVYDRPQRVAMLVYLEEMGPDTGQLLVYPHKPGDAVDPPFPVASRHWDGQVAVSGPPGTVVLLEQSTWHAVLPRTERDELRMFVGFWFAAAGATKAEASDPSLQRLDAPDEVLASVLP